MPSLGRGTPVWFSPPAFGGGDLAIRGFGLREAMAPGMVDRPTGTGDWLLMLFHSQVALGVPGEAVQRTCAPGTLVIWRPGQPHWFGATTHRWRHSWLHADGAFVRSTAAASRLATAVPISGLPRGAFERCLADIDVELRGQARPDRVIVANTLHIFLRIAARAAPVAASPVPERWLAVRRAIEDRYREELLLDDLAALARCSATHLCDEFRRHFGVPPYRFLLNLRLEHARVLVLDRSQTVAEVARAVGFADVRHFTRIFTKHHGMSPARLRLSAG